MAIKVLLLLSAAILMVSGDNDLARSIISFDSETVLSADRNQSPTASVTGGPGSPAVALTPEEQIRNAIYRFGKPTSVVPVTAADLEGADPDFHSGLIVHIQPHARNNLPQQQQPDMSSLIAAYQRQQQIKQFYQQQQQAAAKKAAIESGSNAGKQGGLLGAIEGAILGAEGYLPAAGYGQYPGNYGGYPGNYGGYGSGYNQGYYPGGNYGSNYGGYYPYSMASKYFGGYPSSYQQYSAGYPSAAMSYYGYPSSSFNFGSLASPVGQQQQQLKQQKSPHRPYALPVNSRILAAIASNAGPISRNQPLVGYLSKPSYAQQLARSGVDQEDVQRAADEAAFADGPFVYLVPEEGQQQGAF